MTFIALLLAAVCLLSLISLMLALNARDRAAQAERAMAEVLKELRRQPPPAQSTPQTPPAVEVKIVETLTGDPPAATASAQRVSSPVEARERESSARPEAPCPPKTTESPQEVPEKREGTPSPQALEPTALKAAGPPLKPVSPPPSHPARAEQAMVARKQAPQSEVPSALSEKAEFRWGSRWATYLGLAMAILGAIFFAVHVGMRTPPMVRWLGLAGLTGIFLALGHYMRVRWGNYARSLFSGGLVLGYLTAFAAHAFPPVRIVESPFHGWLLQLAALVGIVAVAAAKRNAGIAYLAAGLGAVAGYFTIALDLSPWTLPYAVGWSIGLVTLGSLRRWDGVQWTGLAMGLFLFLSQMWAALWDFVPAPTQLETHLTALALTALIFVSGLFRSGSWEKPPYRLAFLAGGAGLIVTLHLICIWSFHPGHLAWSYLGWSGIFAVATLWAHSRKEPESLVHGWLLKALTLLTLFIVAYFEGEVRMLALALQGWALISLWKRDSSPWVLQGWRALWLVASMFFIHQVSQANPGELSWMGFLTGLLAFLSLLEQVQYAPEETASAQPSQSTGEDWAQLFSLAAFAILAIGGLFALGRIAGIEDLSFAWLLGGLLLALYSAFRQNIGGLWIAAACGVCSLLIWWSQPEASTIVAPWVMGTYLMISSALVSGIARLGQEHVSTESTPNRTHLLWLEHLGMLSVLITLAFWAPLVVGGAGPQAVLFAGVALAGMLIPERILSSAPRLSLLPALFAVLIPMDLLLGPGIDQEHPLYLLAWALLLAQSFVLRWSPARGHILFESAHPILSGTQLGLVLVLWFVALGTYIPGGWLVLSSVSAVLIHYVLHRFRPSTGTAIAMGWQQFLLWVLLCVLATDFRIGETLDWISLLVGCAFLLAPFYFIRSKQHVSWVAFSHAAGLWIVLAILPFGIGGEFVRYATAIWAFASFGIFALGLGTRQAGARLVSLIGFSATLIRAFSVDLVQTEERIIAFFGLGILLLGVGFLYQRIQRASQETDKSKSEPPPLPPQE